MDLKQSEKKGTFRQKNLEIACRLARVGSFVLHPASDSLELSDEAAGILAVEPGEAVDLSKVLRLFEGEEQEKVAGTLKKILDEGESGLVSFRLTTREGETRWIRGFGERVEDDRGLRIEGALQDITQVMVQHEDARHMDLLLKNIFEVNPDILFLLHEDGRILDYRVQEESLLYAPPEVFLNQPVMEVIPLDQARLFMAGIEEARSGRLGVFEFPLGENFYECRLSRLEGQDKYFAIVRDITEKHRAQEALSRSEDQLRKLLEYSPYPIIVSSLKEGTLLYGNARARSHFGVSEGYVGLRAEDFYKTPEIREAFLEVLFREGSVDDFEMILLDCEKKPYWAVASASIVDFMGEKAIMMAINDITERKQMERAIKRDRDRLKERIKEQECLQEVFNATENPGLPLVETLPGILEAIREGFQYPADCTVEIRLGDWVYGGLVTEASAPLMRVSGRTGSGEEISLAVGYRRKHRFLHEEKILLDQVLHRILETVDRRSEAKAMAEKDALVRTIFEVSSDAIMFMNPDTEEIVHFNQEACRRLGYTPEEFKRLKIKDFQYELSQEVITETVKKVMKEGALRFETRHRRKDGTPVEVMVTLSGVVYDGVPILSSVARDITEQKKEQGRVEASNQRLKKQNRVLQEIMAMPSVTDGDVGAFAPKITEHIARELEICRVSIWIYEEDSGNLRCVDLYERKNERHSGGMILSEEDFEPEIDYLRTHRFLDASKALEDERSRGLTQAYLEPNGIQSMLDLSITSRGKNIGVICFEQVDGIHQWTGDEIAFGTSVADQLGMGFLNHERLGLLSDLEKNQIFLERAQEVSKTGHWFVDFSGNGIEISDETRRILGLEPEKAVSREEFFKILDDEESRSLSGAVQEALTLKKPLLTRIGITVAGIDKWVEIRGYFEYDDQGHPFKAIGTLRDITDQVRVDEELEAYRHNLEEMVKSRTQELQIAKRLADEANQAKTLFLSNMSHEIRTPLNAIIGYAHLIPKESLTQRQRSQVEKLSTAAKGLAGVVNDILDLSKIEANKMALEIQDFEPSRVIDNILNLVYEEAEKKGVLLLVDLDHVPKRLRGDGARFGQVLLNLVGNAVKFTEEGEVGIRAKVIEGEDDQVLLRFEVEDTGIGLTKDQMHRLFNDFQQADDSTTRRFGGTGLGLSISKRITELMGGRIGVESSYGVGSIFWVEIPFEKADEEFAWTRPFITLLNQRVLVIDDDASAREIISEMVKELGMQVDLAASGEEGLVKLKEADAQDPYRLLILDYRMPGMNGVETVQAMAGASLENPPETMILTAYGNDVQNHDLQGMGIHKVLLKPVTSSRLYDAFEELLKARNFGNNQPEAAGSYEYSLKDYRGARVLVTEDNEVIQEITRQLLENVGIDVTLARNGLEALEQIEERTYDLVLMDVQMPVMDGLEAARRIRERKGGGGIPIVAMTANVFKENIRECLAAGMDDHLAKPIEPEKLYHTILKWLKQGRVTRPSAAAVLAESVKAEDPEELTSLEALEGLDVAVGIGLTGGRPQAYVKLLKKFLEQQQDTGELLRREAGEEDPSRLFQRIHSLKGTTGSLGMGHLYALCLESEAACTAEEESQACLEKVTELASSLDEMSGQLEKFLETGAFRKQAVILDDRELAVICNDLREKLVAYDTRAIDIFEGFKSRLGEMEGVDQGLVEGVRTRIENFDFDEALEALDRIFSE